jgi:hypothetical protein
MTPPAIREAEFVALDTIDEEELKRRFGGFVRSLHNYLNQIPCLRDVQKVRRRWKARVANSEAFGTFATDPKHWYTFHHGGRNEAQFNLGFYTTHVRIGLGFEFTLKKGGDPTAVHLAYACFANWMRAKRPQFQRFVEDNNLEIEWRGDDGMPLQFVQTPSAIDWLLNPPTMPSWIFVGRLLRRGRDAATLDDPVTLDTVMQTVLCGFKPVWEQVQLLASAK